MRASYIFSPIQLSWPSTSEPCMMHRSKTSKTIDTFVSSPTACLLPPCSLHCLDRPSRWYFLRPHVGLSGKIIMILQMILSNLGLAPTYIVPVFLRLGLYWHRPSWGGGHSLFRPTILLVAKSAESYHRTHAVSYPFDHYFLTFFSNFFFTRELGSRFSRSARIKCALQ
jgi:hypothetical protein